jgi:NTE family protein
VIREAESQTLGDLVVVITELASHISEAERRSSRVEMLASYDCVTRMHVVRLIAPALDVKDHAKGIDFSRIGIPVSSPRGAAQT